MNAEELGTGDRYLSRQRILTKPLNFEVVIGVTDFGSNVSYVSFVLHHKKGFSFQLHRVDESAPKEGMLRTPHTCKIC